MKSNMRYIYASLVVVLLLSVLSCSNSPTGPNSILLLNSDLASNSRDDPNGSIVYTTSGIGSNVGANAGFGIPTDENTRGLFGLHWHQENDIIVGSASASASGPRITISNDGVVGQTTSPSLDMGEVSLKFGEENVKLFKQEENDRISYTTRSEDGLTGQIAFQPGAVYTFSTTGSEDLGALNVSLPAPEEFVRIVDIDDNGIIDPGAPLLIKWKGKHSQVPPTIVLYPLIWRDVSFGQNQKLLRTLLQPEIIELKKDANQFTLSARTLDRFASAPSDVVAGLVVFVVQNVVTRTDVGGSNFVAAMRNQDARVLYFSGAVNR